MWFCFHSSPYGLPLPAMSDPSSTGNSSFPNDCRIQGWIAPEDAEGRTQQTTSTSMSYRYDHATMAYQPEAVQDTSSMQHLHFMGHGEYLSVVPSESCSTVKSIHMSHSQLS